MSRKPHLVMIALVVLSACGKSELVDDADAGDGAVEAGRSVDASMPDASLPAHITAPVVSYPFGVVAPGSTNTVTLHFVNDGGRESGVLTLWLVANDFDVVDDTCFETRLAAGATCSVTLRFSSMTLGDHRATLHAEADPGGHEVIEILATVAQTSTGRARGRGR